MLLVNHLLSWANLHAQTVKKLNQQQNRTEEYNKQNNTLHSTIYKESKTAGRKDLTDNIQTIEHLSF